jgi:NADH:ubiquinone oxidoreductase subunit E
MEIALIACIKERTTTKPSCAVRGSLAVIEQIEAEIKKRQWPIEVERVKCLGECDKGPNMRIAPGGRFFYGITPDTVSEVMDGLQEALDTAQNGQSTTLTGA